MKGNGQYEREVSDGATLSPRKACEKSLWTTYRKMTPVATSTGWPGRPSGPLFTPAMFCGTSGRVSTCAMRIARGRYRNKERLRLTSAEKVECTSGVTIGPGATALTRMSFDASWFAQPRVNETIAPLVAGGGNANRQLPVLYDGAA